MLFSPTRLRDARERNGKSKEQAAVEVGRSFSAICQYESGASRPSLETLEALALAYDVAPGDLFDEAGAA